MKESVATSYSFKMVLIFTFLFAAFLALAITYNKVFKVKNETISILEKYEGVTEKSLGIVNNYLKNSGYTEKGSCETNEFGVKSLDNPKYEKANANEKYYYCLSYYCKNVKSCKLTKDERIFYDIKLFFKFNLPYVGDLITFDITGETKEIKYYKINQKLK